MKALHEQIAMLAEAFQINLAQFARSMEPARNFQLQLAKLAKTFEAVGELQGQFLELSETFRVAFHAPLSMRVAGSWACSFAMNRFSRMKSGSSPRTVRRSS